MPLLIGIGVLALVIVAAIVAVVLGGTTGGGLAEPARAAVGVSGTSLPALTDAAADVAVGQTLPTMTGTDLAGEPISVGPGDGPMAIVLLAHWCSHCQAEVPVLVDYLASRGMPDGVRLVALSTSIDPARPNYPPSTWLERESWTVPTLVDDGSSRGLAALGMSSFPGFVFVDGDGRVVQRSTGEMPAEAFDQVVRALAP
jgi:thiol-disulfide isomerase/thioredoxin